MGAINISHALEIFDSKKKSYVKTIRCELGMVPVGLNRGG